MAGRSSTFALSAAATPYGTPTPRLPCCAPRKETTLLCDLLHHSPILSDRKTRKNLCSALRRFFKPKRLNRTMTWLLRASCSTHRATGANTAHTAVSEKLKTETSKISVVCHAWSQQTRLVLMTANKAEAVCFSVVLPTPDEKLYWKGSWTFLLLPWFCFEISDAAPAASFIVHRFIIQPLYYLLLQWHDRDFQIETHCWAVKKGKT